ncbi:MAG: DUF2177 family protein [Eubacteriales bacterium]|jgi:uncharacterized membrane protein|nr:DUF2177 family protein [Eubacteriales bacterium]
MIRQSLLIRYLVTTGIFLLIDAAWLGLIAPKLYKANIGHLMAEKPNFLAAGVFYLIYIAALLFFVIDPALVKASVWQAVWTGAFLGLAMYATYDLTNLATLKEWPLKITAIDLAWGTFITAATSGIVTRIFL